MIIDWSKVPTKFKFAAKDPSGQIFVFENKPVMSTIYRSWQNTGKGSYGRAGKCHNTTISWTSSLIERPKDEENLSMNIDWSKVPENFNYIAKDRNCRVYSYMDKPYICSATSQWKCSNGSHAFMCDHDMSDVDWKESLVERPSTKEEYLVSSVGTEAHLAIESLLSSTKTKIPKMLGTLLDEDKLFEMIPDELFEAYLTGWLSAKGMSLEGLDLTKSGNWKQSESK